MAKTWSINTTVRNPDRIKSFLTQIQKLEGKPFNEKNQEEFFKLQIKHHLYNPTRRTLGNDELVEEVNNEDEEVSKKALGEIINIYRGKSVDAAARGRTTAGVLNRYGLTVAAKSKGEVKLTDPAKKWLKEEISDRGLFLKLLLKWQYPNPIESGYSNFGIKPFVGVLHLINKVNKRWSEIGNNPVGISKKEFAMFGITLKNYQAIDDVVEKLIAFRQKSQNLSGQERKKFRNSFIKKKLRKVFDSTNQTKWNNLRDYADCAIRYFRITEFIYLRGKNNYIDLAPSYLVQINKLLAFDNASARDFADYEEYLEYLEDLSLPTLPWENLDDLLTIKQELINDIQQFSTEVKKPQIEQQLKKLPTTKNIYQLKEQINLLEDIYNDLKIKRLSKYRYNHEELEKFVDGISNATASNPTKIVTTRPSLDLEWFTSLSLMVLNDAEEIKPSYKLGDDGIPTGFRPSVSDIECYYQNFNLAVEVTNQRGRQQWMSEAQPVMRHFRDFEEKSTKERNYCLFIAPHIRRDTLNYFWTAIKYEYEGQPQKIVPLTTDQFMQILKFAENQFGKGNLLKHEDYQGLFDTFFQENILETNSQDWINKFNKLIGSWQEKIKAKYDEN